MNFDYVIRKRRPNLLIVLVTFICGIFFGLLLSWAVYVKPIKIQVAGMIKDVQEVKRIKSSLVSELQKMMTEPVNDSPKKNH